MRRLRLSETGVVIDKKGRGRPAAAEGEQQRRTTESVIRIVGNAFPHHSQPINIDAKRANRVVEIKMLVMAVPQKVRMQIIRHGVG